MKAVAQSRYGSQLLRRVPAGSVRGGLRQAGLGVAEGIDTRWQQAMRVRGQVVTAAGGQKHKGTENETPGLLHSRRRPGASGHPVGVGSAEAQPLQVTYVGNAGFLVQMGNDEGPRRRVLPRVRGGVSASPGNPGQAGERPGALRWRRPDPGDPRPWRPLRFGVGAQAPAAQPEGRLRLDTPGDGAPAWTCGAGSSPSRRPGARRIARAWRGSRSRPCISPTAFRPPGGPRSSTTATW